MRLADIPVERVDTLLDEVFSINVKGYVLTARIFLDLLEAEGGAVVLTCSQAVFAADGGGWPTPRARVPFAPWSTRCPSSSHPESASTRLHRPVSRRASCADLPHSICRFPTVRHPG